MKTRALVPIISAADAVLAVLVGAGIPFVFGLVVWLSQGAVGDAGVPLRAGAAVWALSLGGTVTVFLDPAWLGAGTAEPIVFAVGFAPLGLTAVTVVAGLIAGGRLREGHGAWVPAVVGVGVFAITAAVVASAASQPVGVVDVVRTTALGTLWYALALVVGARAWAWAEFEQVRDAVDAVRLRVLTGVVRGVAVMGLTMLVLAVTALAVALVIGLGRVLAVFQSLQLDVAGAIAMGLAQLAILPNAVVWAACWLLGPGFEIGAGSTVAPTGTVAAPLPLVPLLGALPEAVPGVAVVVVALPIVAGVLGAVAMRRVPAAVEYTDGWRRAAAPLLAALVTAIGCSLAALAAGGPVGPGRLAVAGPPAAWVLLMAFATLGVGALIGAYLPLRSEFRGEDDDDDVDVDRPTTSVTPRTAAGRTSRRPFDRATDVVDDDAADEAPRRAAASTRRAPESTERSQPWWSAAADGRRTRSASARDDVDEIEVDDETDDEEELHEVTGGARDRRSTAPSGRGRRSGAGSSEPTVTRARTTSRTPIDDDEPDIYAGIDPLADE